MTSLSIRSNNAIKSFPGKNNIVLALNDKAEMPPCATGVQSVTNRYTQKFITHCSAFFRPELVLLLLITLCVFFALLSFRGFDDNRLTSWQWIFAQANMPMVSLLLVTGLITALVLSAVKISHNHALFTLLFCSALIPVFHWSNPEIIVDAGRYFSQAKYLELYGIAYFLEQWGKTIMAWTDLPLVPFIYGIAFKLFGESRIGIQVLNTFFFTGTVLLTYCIGKKLWNPQTGLYGAAMLLAIPYLHTQIPLLMVDVAAMFFLTLAVFLYIQAIANTKSDSVFLMSALAAVGIILALLTKYSTGLMLSILPVITSIYYWNTRQPESRKNILRQSGFVLIGVSILAAVVIAWGYEIFAQQVALLINYQMAIIGGWTESHLSTFFFQVYPYVSLAALYSVYLAYRRRDYKFLILAWMLLLILLLDIKRIRYVLIAFPMLALMSGYAISNLNHEKLRRYLVLSILVSASTISILGQAAFLNGSSAVNIKHAGEYIDKLNVTSVEVITLEQSSSIVNPVMSIPLFDLYTQKLLYVNDDSRTKTTDDQNNYLDSTLRFTWEYKLPEYYQANKNRESTAVAIVMSSEKQAIPAHISKQLSGYYKVKSFNTQENIFRYRTVVDIYLPKKLTDTNTIKNHLMVTGG